MQDFRELDVWKRAHALVLEVYRTTRGLPSNESFGLTHQLRRAATNVAARIADGCGRDGNVEFAAELRRARAAASELEYLCLLARDLGYIGAEEYERTSESTVTVRKMMSGLLKRM